MYAPTDNRRSSQPFLMRFLVRCSWEYRRPRLWAGVRFACGAWNLGLGILLLTYGYWVGAVPLLASPLLFWTGYRLQLVAQSGSAAVAASHGAK